jgi:superfamily II DNA helicase RecQ
MAVNCNNAAGELTMAKAKQKKITWLSEVEEHDYPAAESYLSLIYNAEQVAKMTARFRHTPVVQFKAKDIFRASQLSLLGVSNSHVEKDWEKIRQRQSLSPLLLVRDEQNGKLVIADGYHRLCAVYGIDEDASIPCKII